jgi:predicted LPLAT superfamily acyltransferase
MRTFQRGLTRLATALVLACCSQVAAAELVVIVSARSPVTVLRAEQVADIFLGQIGSFPGGQEAVALDQRLGSPERDEFYV